MKPEIILYWMFDCSGRDGQLTTKVMTSIVYIVCGDTCAQPGTLYLDSLSLWYELLTYFHQCNMREFNMYLFCANGKLQKGISYSLTIFFPPLISGYKK